MIEKTFVFIGAGIFLLLCILFFGFVVGWAYRAGVASKVAWDDRAELKLKAIEAKAWTKEGKVANFGIQAYSSKWSKLDPEGISFKYGDHTWQQKMGFGKTIPGARDPKFLS